MPPRILLVDDDVELAGMLRDYLAGDGFVADVVHDGEAALVALRTGSYALAVVDVMMPGMSGIDLLRAIRTTLGNEGVGRASARHVGLKPDLPTTTSDSFLASHNLSATSTVPVLMLTARGDDADRILGLELGADDYVPKPCTPRELAARIRAILRRAAHQPQQPGTPPLVSGDLTLCPEQRLATCASKTLELTSTEFSLLEILARHAGQPVSKAALSEQGLGREFSRYDRSIDVHISSIRQKLAPLSDGRSRIQTVFRKGYQLVPEQG